MTGIGLFSTLTGPGSRALVGAIASACAAGDVGDVEVAFLFVNREEGESDVTDDSVEAIASQYSFPIMRRSAVRFEKDARRAARVAEEAGDSTELWAWRERFYESYRHTLPATDLDLLLGDMWVWSEAQCVDRRGVNLHPALPGGPVGKMWFDVIWDLVEEGAVESGVMLHRVTPEVDLGPVVSYCRYSLRAPELETLWGRLPHGAERARLIAGERSKKRDSGHPLFEAIRAEGARREVPLMLATVAAVAAGDVVLRQGAVFDRDGRALPVGADLTEDVEKRL